MATTNAYEISNTLEECSICLSPLTQQGMDVYTTACLHKFHFQCLAKNVRARNNECPLCRAHLGSLVDILNATSTPTSPVPIQNIPTPTPEPTQTQPPVTNTGVWGTLTKTMSNAFSWVSGPSTRPVSSSHTQNASRRTIFSSPMSSSEDFIDQQAVTALSNRINAARQQSIEGHTQFPSIIATTALEFGGQESTKQSNIYGMVTLKAPSILSNRATEKELDELRVPVDLVCVVDQSGSMGGQKIALLKDTLNYIVDQMGPLDRLAIISFDTRAFDRSQGLKLMTTEKKQTLRNAITQNIRASGGTYIGSGLEMAIKLLRDRQAANPLGALLVLTDGQDNQRHDYSNLMEQLPENVVCHTFGYGSDHNAALLSQLAEQGHGGTFTYIDQVDGVGHAFATALGGLFTCIAKQLRIKLEFSGAYTVTHARTTYSYEPQQLPYHHITFKMTDLNADETRNLVFQVHVPKLNASDENNPIDDTIGHVSLEYIDANTNQTIRTEPVPFLLARPSQIAPQSSLLKVNYELDIQRNRAETSEVLKRAVVETDYERAREMVNVQLEKIRSSVSAESPLCQQLIRDLEFQYSSQREFQTTMTNMYMQHGQERATYSTVNTTSANCYMTSGQERFRSKFSVFSKD
ncbi:unnamed protein product [Rotaria magnacalcarata]|uniref:Uncharacterized protein n=12 Tax=Rotaria magnacalcarata TaxID=392030 RepID=A0A815IVD8_9BILA|nr:unnamed protein product [Rotaria magnacalcarata]CAF4252303.1 unnamed protein product [Rotaria magnacalcarata]